MFTKAWESIKNGELNKSTIKRSKKTTNKHRRRKKGEDSVSVIGDYKSYKADVVQGLEHRSYYDLPFHFHIDIAPSR